MGIQVFKINPDGGLTETKSESPIKDMLKTVDCYVIVADKIFLSIIHFNSDKIIIYIIFNI